ncbi:MAG: hypothetical protein PVG66_14230 [Chromatiales bacterium]|jgi:hypothetical protein
MALDWPDIARIHIGDLTWRLAVSDILYSAWSLSCLRCKIDVVILVDLFRDNLLQAGICRWKFNEFLHEAKTAFMKVLLSH